MLFYVIQASNYFKTIESDKAGGPGHRVILEHCRQPEHYLKKLTLQQRYIYQGLPISL